MQMNKDYFHTNLSKPSIFTDDEYFEYKHVFDLSNEIAPQKRKKAKITLFEQDLLKLIANQQVLSLKQLHRIYNAYYPIKYKTLRKKLNRWAEKNILHVRRPSVKSVMGYPNLYSIGKVGLKILVEEDSERWLEVNNSLFTKKNNFVHGIGQQDVVVELMLHFMKYGIHFTSISPYNLFGEDKSFGIPDWVLKYRSEDNEEKNFYIEFDVGTERLKVMNDKHEAYMQRALEKPDENIIVLYSLMDESFHYRGDRTPNGPRRLSNLKQYFLDSNKVLPNNLIINVHYLSRVGSVVENILLPNNKEQPLSVLENYFEEIGMNVEHVLSKGFYMREVPESHYADGIWELRNKDGLLEERIAVIVANEGDIRSFQRINGLYQAMNGRLFNSTIHRLIILYDNDVSSISDSQGTKFDKSVIMTDVESLKSEIKPFRSFYGVFQTKKTVYPFKEKRKVLN